MLHSISSAAVSRQHPKKIPYLLRATMTGRDIAKSLRGRGIVDTLQVKRTGLVLDRTSI